MSRFTIASAFALSFLAGSLSAQQFADQTATRLPIQAVWSEEVDAADIDGDGDLDLVYGKGNGFSSAGTAQQNTILINGGAGVFADQTASRLPVQLSNTKDLDLLDVDRDGDQDLVVANAFGQQPRLYLNNGAGVFTDSTATHFPALTLNSFAVAGGDIDNDGDLDLMFTDSGATTFGGAGGQPRCFLNDGTGHFSNQPARLPVTLITSCVDADLVDVDNDFDLDLIVVSRDGSPSRLFLNDGTGFYTNGSLPADGAGTYEYATGDVDSDADADIFVIGQNGLAEGLFKNDGTGTFTLTAGAISGNPSSDDNDASLGDIDNDGDFDVAIASLSPAPERILTNNGTGVFTYNASLITSLVDSSLDGEFADVDNDGDLDYVTAVGESGAFQNRIYINATGAADSRPPVFRLQTLGPSTPGGTIPVLVAIRDILASDNDPDYQSVTLSFSVNGIPGTMPMDWSGADFFRGRIPFAIAGQTVMYSVTAVDRFGNLATSSTVTFSPGSSPGSPFLAIATPGLGAVSINIFSAGHPSAEEFLFVSTVLPAIPGTGPFFGLNADAFNIVLLPTGVPPLHHFLDATGLLQTAFGPGSLPSGFTFDARAVIVANPAPVSSNLLRVTIR